MEKKYNYVGGGGPGKIKICGGGSAKIIKYVGGPRKNKNMWGGSAKFSIPPPPQDLKWNSPNLMIPGILFFYIF